MLFLAKGDGDTIIFFLFAIVYKSVRERQLLLSLLQWLKEKTIERAIEKNCHEPMYVQTEVEANWLRATTYDITNTKLEKR